MELLPIIYNSLIIAAGLFVITLAISYVSYKFRQKNGDDVKATASATQDKHLKNEDDAELKPKYKSPPPGNLIEQKLKRRKNALRNPSRRKKKFVKLRSKNLKKKITPELKL
ncbi:MAG: hypothetical protein U5K00_12135 [Melioribacteraceae bacterium]|nr:hypothetical protein [Melioribacteraceae bacterium]